MSVSNYAKALYAIAKEQDKVNLITVQFGNLKNTIAEKSSWVSMMDSPMISFDEKMKRIDALDFDSSFLAFLKMLSSKHQMHLCLEIYDEWIHLARAYQNIAHIHIYSAKEVTKEQELTLRKVIQPRFPNQTLDFHITIDEHLLGGIKIVHQGQSLDRSVARELKELYTTI
ncbi:MAG: ATP synthase F1 subunit delta [Tenericutes bacterium HGW-Tenericutes-3]|nr:MAG: ATP synthase F1 subunit delta [Tenericutes bacterium HGW-Tenericutes-3]